jgi:coproporphyrinogen III oxidase-like Fe-S oxidoreductase
VRSNPEYQKALSEGRRSGWFELEVLSDQERFHEQLLTQLRRAEGLSRSMASGRDLDRVWTKWIRQGMLASDERGWRLQGEGWLWADAVAADAFGVEA